MLNKRKTLTTIASRRTGPDDCRVALVPCRTRSYCPVCRRRVVAGSGSCCPAAICPQRGACRFCSRQSPLLLVVLGLLPLSRREVSCYCDVVLSEGFSEVSVTEDRQLIVDVTESGDQGAWVAPRSAGHWADAMGFFNVAVDPFSVTGEVIQRSYQLFYVGCLVVSC